MCEVVVSGCGTMRCLGVMCGVAVYGSQFAGVAMCGRHGVQMLRCGEITMCESSSV